MPDVLLQSYGSLALDSTGAKYTSSAFRSSAPVSKLWYITGTRDSKLMQCTGDIRYVEVAVLASM